MRANLKKKIALMYLHIYMIWVAIIFFFFSFSLFFSCFLIYQSCHQVNCSWHYSQSTELSMGQDGFSTVSFWVVLNFFSDSTRKVPLLSNFTPVLLTLINDRFLENLQLWKIRLNWLIERGKRYLNKGELKVNCIENSFCKLTCTYRAI